MLNPYSNVVGIWLRSEKYSAVFAVIYTNAKYTLESFCGVAP
jgi:hypothetical protein